MEKLHYPVVLSIAGSDPSGGAGIQADIKTCAALGVYAMTALTALTAQNTLGVRSVMPAGPAMLRAQLEAVLDDITPDAVKIGMVPDAASAKVIAGCIETYRLGNIVLDPVMAATSGHSLAGIDVLDAMWDSLFPLADIITPNLPEASAIAGRAISRATTADALCLLEMTGAGGVLLKGGHDTSSDTLTDVIAIRTGGTAYTAEKRHRRIESPNTHGTGCSLSSAVAAMLALGLAPAEAASRAVEALAEAVEAGAGYGIGHGHGAVNHFAIEKFRII